jgi:3-oxoacyl-[acyl-carrier-protein] synthase-3
VTFLDGLAHALPERVLDNAALAAEFGVEPEWILEASGIRERRVVSPGESVTTLAERAARASLAAAGLEPHQLGAIVCGTGTPPRQFPGLSADVQAALGAGGIPAFDIHLASVGGLFALAVATDLCARHGPVLIVAAEEMSTVMARGPRVKETAILFGDGAGACVVRPGEGPLSVVDLSLGSDGANAAALCMDHGGALQMDGRTVILQANRKLRAAITTLLERHNLKSSDVGLWLFHQANLNLLRQVGGALGIDPARVFVNLDRYGNTSSASLLIAMSEARAQGRLRAGERAVLAAFGSGLSWGAILLDVRA